MRKGDFHCIVQFLPRSETGGYPRNPSVFGHDEVAPLSQQPLDPRNGWGATIVDAMSTMVCGSLCLPDVFELNNDDLVHHGTHGMTTTYLSPHRA